MNKYGSIYIIKNIMNDKVYIGQTTMSVDDRFKAHIKKSTIEKRTYKLYNALKKYGKENFYIESLEDDVPIELLDKKEIYYINKYNSYKNGYNSTKGGDGRIINKKYDEDEIIKLYKKELSMPKIAKLYSVSSATISRVLKRNNVETRENGNKYKQINEKEFKKRWYANNNLKEMAKYFKCNERTITRYARKLNLPYKNKNIYRDKYGRYRRIID